MKTHTPGPWKLIDHDEDYIAITDEEQGFGVCKLEESASESREVMKANAHLIAAAPELLEALECVLAIADRNTKEFDMARAAIARATSRRGKKT